MRQNARALVQAAVLAALLTPFVLAGCDSGSPTADGPRPQSVAALSPHPNDTLDASRGPITIEISAAGDYALGADGMTEVWVSLEATVENVGDRYRIFSVRVKPGILERVTYDLNDLLSPNDRRTQYGRIRVSTTKELNERPDGSARVHTIAPIHFVRSPL